MIFIALSKTLTHRKNVNPLICVSPVTNILSLFFFFFFLLYLIHLLLTFKRFFFIIQNIEWRANSKHVPEKIFKCCSSYFYAFVFSKNQNFIFSMIAIRVFDGCVFGFYIVFLKPFCSPMFWFFPKFSFIVPSEILFIHVIVMLCVVFRMFFCRLCRLEWFDINFLVN